MGRGETFDQGCGCGDDAGEEADDAADPEDIEGVETSGRAGGVVVVHGGCLWFVRRKSEAEEYHKG